jgi:hypothetical protein
MLPAYSHPPAATQAENFYPDNVIGVSDSDALHRYRMPERFGDSYVHTHAHTHVCMHAYADRCGGACVPHLAAPAWAP